MKTLDLISKENLTIVEYYIKTDNIYELKELRRGYVRHLPLELIHQEDRAICELIDNFLETRKKVIDFIKNYEFEEEGSHVLEMDQFPGFFCYSNVDVDIDIDKGDYLTSPVADTKIRIVYLSFTILDA